MPDLSKVGGKLMEQANPPEIDPTIYNDNLVALARTDPALADRLARGEGIPVEPPQCVLARDGQVTFLLRNGDGQPVWFGRTSLPSVRSQAVLARFDAGVGNVLLPGIGQGDEVSRLLERLGPHRAVFVWEPDLQSVRLALSLHRWSTALDRLRLIFLACHEDGLCEALLESLARRPGHLCPERILMWPGASHEAMANCRSAVQQAYSEIRHRRAQQIESLRTAMTERACGRDRPTGSHWAVFSLDPRSEYVALGEMLAEAIGRQGDEAVAVGVRGPGDMHPLARLQRVADGLQGRLPDAAILLNATRSDLPEMLAEDTPIISWLDPACRVDESLVARFGPSDSILAASSRIRERLCKADVPADRITVLAWPCLVEPIGEDPCTEEAASRPIDVAFVADRASTEPHAYGLTLWTHEQLWKAACRLIRARLDRFTEDDGDEVLKRAQRECGARIEDAASRSAIRTALSTSVANALVRASLIEALTRAGGRPTVYGTGWPQDGTVQVSPWPKSLQEQFALLRRVKVLVYADVTGTVTHLPLLAAASGAVLVARSHRRDRWQGGLATLLEPGKEMADFSTSRELIQVVGRLLGQPEYRAGIASAALHRCKQSHTPRVRWDVLQKTRSAAL